MTRIPVGRALISVSDKHGLTPFAVSLVELGVEIVSSGGTADHLEAAGIPVFRVEDVTGAPEMLGGRVKTLHPRVHGGILADLSNSEHLQNLTDFGVRPFQLVVVNLYPFEETVAGGASDDMVIENIDIGGPTMIRAAAKNHKWVAVVVSPERYDDVVAAVATGGTTSKFRKDLAKEAFFRTARYDAAIVNWMEAEQPERIVLPLRRHTKLRYGENPHQPASLYALGDGDGWWAKATQIQGKEMSFNNYADADSAWRLVNDLPDGAVAILKHMNACGAAVGDSLLEAFEKAWDCDPLSAFGGVIAVNAQLDGDTAKALSEYFVEIVVAPSISEGAAAVLAQKKNLRVLIAPAPETVGRDIRAVDGGMLVQDRDVVEHDPGQWEAQTRRPTKTELRDLEMAWVIAAHTKSNAVVIVKDGAAVGVGAGDQSRIGAAERAVVRAGGRAKGAACASDAFFPFRDGPDALAAAGISALVEPGGSVRDDEVITSARENDIALMFTGERHFRH
ncbi:MAG: bifunctional phosphoribosylaminoimidazolecarboxamide formyltransferase/IMP cyclohydrolase [Acidimicrobiia bacterium]